MRQNGRKDVRQSGNSECGIAFTFIDPDDPPNTMQGVVYSTATGVKLCDLPTG